MEEGYGRIGIMNTQLAQSLGKWQIDREDWEKTPESVKRAKRGVNRKTARAGSNA